MDFQLGLRQGRYRVSLVGINSQYEPPLQFALCYPNDKNPYADIITSWGGNPESPRGQQHNSIEIPLERRTQTFLSHQVSPELAQALRGFKPISNNGREGSARHSVEINTHQSNRVSIHEYPAHQHQIQQDNRQQMRESIVTRLDSNQSISQSVSTFHSL